MTRADARKRQQERAQAGAPIASLDAVADYADAETERANLAEAELAEARAVIAAVAAYADECEYRHIAQRLRAILPYRTEGGA